MTTRPKPIRDQVIVVENGAAPVGTLIARRAAAAGARVLLIGPVEASLGEAVRAINNGGGRADYAVAAAGNGDALAAAGQVAVNRFGRVDGWFAEATDEAALAATVAAVVPLLRREGGVLVAATEAVTPAEALRATLRDEAPRVTLAVVKPADAADRVAAAALVCLESGVAGTPVAADPRGFAARHPGLVVMMGIGGLALAAGAVAGWRRGRTA